MDVIYIGFSGLMNLELSRLSLDQVFMVIFGQHCSNP